MRWLLLLFLAGVYSGANAQWKAVTTKWIMTDTLYNIRSDRSLAWDRNFRFPEYFYYEHLHAVQGGIPSTNSGTSSKLELPLHHAMLLNNDSAVLILRLYTENVKGYQLWWYSGRDQQWRTKEVPLPFTGYQIPTCEPPGSWNVIKDGLPETDIRPKNPEQDLLVIRATAIDPGQPSRFIIGNLLTGYRQSIAFPVRHSFFSNLASPIRQVSQVSSGIVYPDLHSEYFNQLPTGMDDISLTSSIDIIPTGPHSEQPAERELLHKILIASLDHYPYYTEKKLDKRKIAWQLNHIFNDPSFNDYCRLLDTLATFIRYTFSDLHFYIDQPKEGICAATPDQKIKPAIRLAEVKGRICIAANFDSSNHAIALNDELQAINGIPVQQVFDSVAARLYGRGPLSTYKRSVVLNTLLDREATDSCVIATRSSSAARPGNTTLTYNKRYAVPASFRSIHADYKRWNDIAYFRIVYWEPAVYLRFINNRNNWLTADKLIIDLRGNGGGEMVSAMQFFALFIDRPALYYQLLDPQNTREAVTILPDKQFSFPPGKKVIILGDQGTACASETFVKAMQRRRQCWFMAATPTAGTLSSKYDLHLPSGVVVHVNGLEKKPGYQTEEERIEDRGIKPNIKVTIEKVEDLRPYEDKLLKEAIKFLSADNRVLPKTD